MRYSVLLIFLIQSFFSWAQSTKEERTKYFPKQELKVNQVPPKTNVWVFIMAGQSNMDGRGFVEPLDTIPDERILTINRSNELVVAKEPIGFYTPDYKGLGCGLAFAKELLSNIPDSITLLLLPTAVGGSPINKWIEDLPHRNIKLYSNFLEKVEMGKQYGEIKAILWHQGESDANEEGIKNRMKNLKKLFSSFRKDIGNTKLPIVIGELGTYSKTPELWAEINKVNHKYSRKDKYSALVETDDLKDKGDRVHFDGASQREMGRRFADQYLNLIFKLFDIQRHRGRITSTWVPAPFSDFTSIVPYIRSTIPFTIDSPIPFPS